MYTKTKKKRAVKFATKTLAPVKSISDKTSVQKYNDYMEQKNFQSLVDKKMSEMAVKTANSRPLTPLNEEMQRYGTIQHVQQGVEHVDDAMTWTESFFN